MDDQDFKETLRGILASAAAYKDDEVAGKMVRDVFGTEDALTLLTARCRVLEAEAADWQASFDLYHKADLRGMALWRAEDPEARALVMPDKGEFVAWLLRRYVGLGDAAMAVANDCRAYVDDEDGPDAREMLRAFLGTLGPAIAEAFPGAEPPYRWGGDDEATADTVTGYVAWGDTGSGSDGRLSFTVRDPDGVLPPARAGADLGSRMDAFLLDDPEWEVFEERLRVDVGGALMAEGDGARAHGWRLPPGTDGDVEKAAAVTNAVIARLRGLGLEVAE